MLRKAYLPNPFFRADLSPDDHAVGVIVLPLPDTGRGKKTLWRTRVAERSCTARELAFALVKKRTTPSYQRFSAYRCGALRAPPCVGEGRGHAGRGRGRGLRRPTKD